jgi:hypothetical protein
MHCVVLSLLGRIPNDLDGLDALVVFITPVQDPHLVEVWDIVQIHWVFVCDHNLKMKTQTKTLHILFRTFINAPQVI